MATTYTTDTGKYVIRDADGYVMAKADVEPGEHVVPDGADPSMCFDVDANTDLSTKLSESPANVPDPARNDPASNAFEKLENVVVDDTYE